MTGFGALFRKELLELVRTHRLLVAGVLYLLVGLGSPLLARAVPALLDLVPKDQLGGVEILITQDPTVKDALAQYLKNLNMLPLVAVLLSMGAVAGERRAQVLPMVLSKPVSRRAYLAAKAAATALLHTFGVFVAACGALLYTRILFGEVWIAGYVALNAVMLLVIFLFAALTLLASVALRSVGAVAAVGLGAYLALSALTALPTFARYTPAGLLLVAGNLVAGRPLEAPWASVAVALGALVLLLGLADRILARQEI